MNSKNRKKHILVPLISAILIVIVGMLNIDFYFKSVMFPFLMILISSTILVKDYEKINKKAYLLIIPIVLIIISNLVLKVLKGNLDGTNQLLNIIVLPLLISTYLFMLVRSDFKVSLENMFLVFKLFPKNLFKNLKFIKIDTKKDKNDKIINIIFGTIIGVFISGLILALLTSADAYFDKFLSSIVTNINVDFNLWYVIKGIIYFVILFVIGINLFKNKEIALKESKMSNINKTVVTTMLFIVNFVFVLFLISEISKLCGNFLKVPKGYIYSSYAREGFFQLLFVTLINFGIILYLIYKTNLVKEDKKVKYLVLSLIAFSIFLIFNSYYRMFLYIGRFGFTNLRLQVILFLFMEIILFGFIIKKIIRGAKKDGMVFLIIMTITYVINLYVCNDWFIGILEKILK
ncbi:putative uncharacterized protein [Clostridium sp. CAG:594]|nr:putative uncharacterized protein [Clostridium sp. CAG:594]